MKAIILSVLMVTSVQTFAETTITKYLLIPQDALICTIGAGINTTGNAPEDSPQAIATVKSIAAHLPEELESISAIDYLISVQPTACKTVREVQATSWHNFGFLPATLNVTESDVLPGFSHTCYKNIYATLTVKPRDNNVKELTLAMGTSVDVACPAK